MIAYYTQFATAAEMTAYYDNVIQAQNIRRNLGTCLGRDRGEGPYTEGDAARNAGRVACWKDTSLSQWRILWTDRNLRIAAEGIRPDKIDEKTIREHLYDPTMPDPELMVRTSGEYRMSNFLMWEMAYSELVFTDVLWPDVDRTHLWAAIETYARRDRRYGGV